MDKAEELFISIAEQHENCEDIIDNLRELNSSGQITDEEYNYILQEWDSMLKKHNL